MKITKDEAAILYASLYEHKYVLNDQIVDYAKKESINSMMMFENLEYRLLEFSSDKRRKGRKSRNTFTDILRRFISSKYKPWKEW